MNLAKILARKQKSHQDPAANLAKILTKKQIHGGKNLGAILPGISPRLATGREIFGEIHCGNLGKILADFRHTANFFWIEPNVYVLKNTNKSKLH